MDIVKQMYDLYKNVVGKPLPKCKPPRGVKKELEQIRKNVRIPLPDDYCKIFLEFWESEYELSDDEKGFYYMPSIAFYNWDEMDDIAQTMTNGQFWEDYRAIPIGTDSGGMEYIYSDVPEPGIYMTETASLGDRESWNKIASSFTELFTSPRAQRRFSHLYDVGYDYDETEWEMLRNAYMEDGKPLPKVLEQYTERVPEDILCVAAALLVEKWLLSQEGPHTILDEIKFLPEFAKAKLMEAAFELHPDKLDYDKLEYHGEYDDDDDDDDYDDE